MVLFKTLHRLRFHGRGVWALALAAVCLLGSAPPVVAGSRAAHGPRASGTVELDVRSEYSHIRVLKQGSVRSLVFVRDTGEAVVETMVNLRVPHELLLSYTRYMFASYLWQPKQERVLIVGLGGGAMVHFYRHFDAEVRVDAVEIDPAVVKIAEKYFKTAPSENVRITTADGLRYLEKTQDRYDVVYMDAFLKPAADTDATGMPRAMKTAEFYKNAMAKLQPEGLMVFNLNTHKGLEDDLRTLRKVFSQVYVFRLPDGNVVVVGSRAAAREKLSLLQDRAKAMDRRFKTSFSFREMLKKLEP